MGTELIYGAPFPACDVLKGFYIDDKTVLYFADEAALARPEGPDKDITDRTHACYDSARMPRSADKGYGFSAQVEKGVVANGSKRFTFLAWCRG